MPFILRRALVVPMAAHAYSAVVRVQFLSPQHAELAARVLDVGKDSTGRGPLIVRSTYPSNSVEYECRRRITAR